MKRQFFPFSSILSSPNKKQIIKKLLTFPLRIQVQVNDFWSEMWKFGHGQSTVCQFMRNLTIFKSHKAVLCNFYAIGVWSNIDESEREEVTDHCFAFHQFTVSEYTVLQLFFTSRVAFVVLKLVLGLARLVLGLAHPLNDKARTPPHLVYIYDIWCYNG